MPIKKTRVATSLPPLPRLKIRKTTTNTATNQCFVLMSSLLNCWAANGEASAACSMFATDLKTCMEAQKPGKGQVSSVNYHASRLYPKLRGKVND
ncbi:37S ribosomal protein Mrp10p, mitochondrial [[Candida] anglica]|uniref:37S ribosomal protein Mrp10p, mitochondrial n=1 Tax=[Candida] anglica TaxID=148631 RepID=A0ABP0EHU9_9ASCO